MHLLPAALVRQNSHSTQFTKVHKSVIFSVLTAVYPAAPPHFGKLSSPQSETPHPPAVTQQHCPPQPLAPSNLLSVSQDSSKHSTQTASVYGAL